jgi:hypothetical protein
MDKETLQTSYITVIKELERLENELEAAQEEENDFVSLTDHKTYGSIESQREAYLAIKFPNIGSKKKLIKQAQRRREYYRDMITLYASK